GRPPGRGEPQPHGPWLPGFPRRAGPAGADAGRAGAGSPQPRGHRRLRGSVLRLRPRPRPDPPPALGGGGKPPMKVIRSLAEQMGAILKRGGRARMRPQVLLEATCSGPSTKGNNLAVSGSLSMVLSYCRRSKELMMRRLRVVLVAVLAGAALPVASADNAGTES